MKIRSILNVALVATVAIAFTACTPKEEVSVPVTETQPEVEVEESGIKVAFIYGDSILANYKFLVDVEVELSQERQLIDDRVRRKFQRAEQRAGELQKEAQYMTQTQMQEAQMEMQGLEMELQQFEQKLAADFREREVELQREYIEKVDAFLDVFNADGTYDMVLNYQIGSNVLWIKEKFDVTTEVVAGLNASYDEELAAANSEEPQETTAP